MVFHIHGENSVEEDLRLIVDQNVNSYQIDYKEAPADSNSGLTLSIGGGGELEKNRRKFMECGK